MGWIKRNLFFVIGTVIAFALMGVAGWYLYSEWTLNNEAFVNLNADYDSLKQLNNQNPHPGNNKIDNIKTAGEQRKELLGFSLKARPYFQPIARIPEDAKITDHEFSGALARTIEHLQKEATNASVILPPNYNFTFEAQKSRLSFAAGSLDRLSVKLGEIKTISDLLFQAKINSLESIRRERVSADDANGPQSDYLSERTVTNDLAVLTPYELTFRCFSSELAAVLTGLAASPHGFVVKTINVEGAPVVATVDTLMPVPTPVYSPVPVMSQPVNDANREASTRAQMLRRYGLAGRGGPAGGGSSGGVAYRGEPTAQQPYVPPTYTPAAPQPGAGKGGLVTVLDEKQLRVTLNLFLVKLLPPKKVD